MWGRRLHSETVSHCLKSEPEIIDVGPGAAAPERSCPGQAGEVRASRVNPAVLR